MKNIILILLANLMILSVSNGQEYAEHFANENALKINPFALADGKFQISYERFLMGRRSSLLISPSIISKESIDQSKRGWEVMSQYRLFLTHKREDQQKTFLGVHNYGFYTGLYGLFFIQREDYIVSYWDEADNQQKNIEANKEVDAMEAGVLLGIQIDITPRILIDFYVGGGIRQADVIDSFMESNLPKDYYYDTYGVLDPEYQGVKPKIGLLLGITF